MFAIIRALKRWKVDLLGSPFLIYIDHKTLENFNHQKDLSRRQARWMEFMSMFNSKIIYVMGGDNTVADALPRLPVEIVNDSSEAQEKASNQYGFCADDESVVGIVLPVDRKLLWRTARSLALLACQVPPLLPDVAAVASTLTISSDKKLLDAICEGYKDDPWCQKLVSTSEGIQGIEDKGGL